MTHDITPPLPAPHSHIVKGRDGQKTFAYQFRHEWNRFPPGPDVGHAVDIAVERIVTGMAIVASASVAGTVSILCVGGERANDAEIN